MQHTPKPYAAYICIRVSSEDDRIKTFRIASTIEEAESFTEEENEKQEELFSEVPSANTLPAEIGDVRAVSPMAALCDRLLVDFFYKLSSYHELIGVANFIRPMMASGLVQTEIFSQVKNKGNLLRSSGDQQTYGLSAAASNDLSQSITRMKETDAGLALLPSSILLSIVATFDSIVGDGVKEILTLRPERILNSDRSLTLKDLFKFNNVNEAKEYFIDDEVDKLLRGSHQSQIEYIEKLVDTKIISHYSRWANFVEVFERRNVVAHANGQASTTYIRNCKACGLNVEHVSPGSQLPLKQSYLHKAVDYLIEFGVLLSFVTWRKLDPPSEADAFERLNDLALDAIKRRRYGLAIWLLDFALHKQPRKGSDLIIRMMFINLANAYKKNNNEEKSQSTLNEIDWSASSDLFKISIASLNKDIATTCNLLKSLAASDSLSANSFRDWPVFDWVRGEAEIAESFEQAFGEALTMQVTTTDKAPSDPSQPTSDDSIH